MAFSVDISSARLLPRKIFSWWAKWRHTIFFLSLVGVLVWGGWEWYRSLYLFAWSDTERSQYIDSKLQIVQFREAKFQAVTEFLTERRQKADDDLPPGKDIFEKNH